MRFKWAVHFWGPIKRDSSVYGDWRQIIGPQEGCKILHVILHYFLLSNYAWMLCEGFYLHTLLVAAFISESRLVKWLYGLGWAMPLVPTVIYTSLRACNSDKNDTKQWVSLSKFTISRLDCSCLFSVNEVLWKGISVGVFLYVAQPIYWDYRNFRLTTQCLIRTSSTSVEITTRLWAGDPRYNDSFLASRREFSVLQIIQAVSGTHPAPYWLCSASFSSRVKRSTIAST